MRKRLEQGDHQADRKEKRRGALRMGKGIILWLSNGYRSMLSATFINSNGVDLAVTVMW